MARVLATNNQSGSNNVYIMNQGPPGSESNTIRIGTQGTGDGQQNAAYIAGIYGSTSSGGIAVYVNSNGQLGTSTSSLRFKEQVRDMGDSTNALMKLRPVTFLYKPEYATGERTLQYGLIAEEVAKVYPELVAYDKDGQPYSGTLSVHHHHAAERGAETVSPRRSGGEGNHSAAAEIRPSTASTRCSSACPGWRH